VRRAIPDYTITYVTELAVMASMLLVYRLAAQYWPSHEFAEYALARRTVGLVQLPLLMGVGIGIPRYIALSLGAGQPAEAGGYYAAGLLLALLPVASAVVLLNVLAGTAARVLFGSPEYAGLVGGFSLIVLGAALHLLAYSYFRGRRRMRVASGLQLLNLGLIPPAAFLVPGWPVERVIGATGAAWSVVSLLVIGVVLARLGPSVWRGGEIKRRIAELARFGLPRVPGEFALTGLFALPATFVAHVAGMEAAGFVAVAITIVSAVGSLFAPVGLVLLPHASEMVARGERARVRWLTGRLLVVGVGLAAALAVGFELVGRRALAAFLEGDFEGLFQVARIIVPGAAPYAAYILARNALDALHARALNTKNLVSGLLVFATVALAWRTIESASLGLLAGLVVLGALSVKDLMGSGLMALSRSHG